MLYTCRLRLLTNYVLFYLTNFRGKKPVKVALYNKFRLFSIYTTVLSDWDTMMITNENYNIFIRLTRNTKRNIVDSLHEFIEHS